MLHYLNHCLGPTDRASEYELINRKWGYFIEEGVHIGGSVDFGATVRALRDSVGMSVLSNGARTRHAVP